MESASLNRILANSQLHLEELKQAEPSKVDRIVNQLSKDLQSLNALRAHEPVDDSMLDKISSTLQSIQSTRAPERSGNAANILQALQEKVEEIRKRRDEVRPKESKHKITRFEIVQFLNSTEKQLERAIILIRERDAEEEQLHAFIEELKKQIEEMKLARALNLKSRKLDLRKQKESLAQLIDELLCSETHVTEARRELFSRTLTLFKKELLAFLT